MKKPAKVVIATTLGAALLLGGSTYALWTSTASSDTAATIQTGGSDLTVVNQGAWVDGQRSTIEGETVYISDINAFRAVPGDKLTFTQDYKVKTAGATTQTRVALDFPNDAAIGVAALRDRGIILSVRLEDGSGNVLASSSATDNTLATNYVINGATATAGNPVVVKFEFEIQGTVTAEDTKKLQTVISNAVLSANQIN